jgi:hypothetical protein
MDPWVKSDQADELPFAGRTRDLLTIPRIWTRSLALDRIASEFCGHAHWGGPSDRRIGREVASANVAPEDPRGGPRED